MIDIINMDINIFSILDQRTLVNIHKLIKFNTLGLN